jgi:hypothetical protein
MSTMKEGLLDNRDTLVSELSVDRNTIVSQGEEGSGGGILSTMSWLLWGDDDTTIDGRSVSHTSDAEMSGSDSEGMGWSTGSRSSGATSPAAAAVGRPTTGTAGRDSSVWSGLESTGHGNAHHCTGTMAVAGTGGGAARASGGIFEEALCVDTALQGQGAPGSRVRVLIELVVASRLLAFKRAFVALEAALRAHDVGRGQATTDTTDTADTAGTNNSEANLTTIEAAACRSLLEKYAEELHRQLARADDVEALLEQGSRVEDSIRASAGEGGGRGDCCLASASTADDGGGEWKLANNNFGVATHYRQLASGLVMIHTSGAQKVRISIGLSVYLSYSSCEPSSLPDSFALILALAFVPGPAHFRATGSIERDGAVAPLHALLQQERERRARHALRDCGILLRVCEARIQVVVSSECF